MAESIQHLNSQSKRVLFSVLYGVCNFEHSHFTRYIRPENRNSFLNPRIFRRHNCQFSKPITKQVFDLHGSEEGLTEILDI